MIDHAGGHAFMRFAGAVNVEVAQADDDPVLRVVRGAVGKVRGRMGAAGSLRSKVANFGDGALIAKISALSP